MCKLSLERETHRTIGMAKRIPRRPPLSVSSVSSVVVAALEVVCHGSSTEGATMPGGTVRENPAGGGSIAGGRGWVDCYSRRDAPTSPQDFVQFSDGLLDCHRSGSD